MKLVLPVSSGTISTAFDFAQHLLLVECDSGKELRRTELAMEDPIPLNRARHLEALQTNVLICGAISRKLSEYLEASGIEVIPFVSGPVNEVINAYLEGGLKSGQFLMPGSTAEQRLEGRARHSAQ